MSAPDMSPVDAALARFTESDQTPWRKLALSMGLDVLSSGESITEKAGDILAAEVLRLRAEREGFDPKVWLPRQFEEVSCLIYGKYRNAVFEDGVFCFAYPETGIAQGHNYPNEVTRWWPLPGGSK